MDRTLAKRTADVLRALADLTSAAEPPGASNAIPIDWFRWLPANSVRLFSGGAGGDGTAGNAIRGLSETPEAMAVQIDRKFAERLAAVDQIRPNQHSLRAGWLFVAGRADEEQAAGRRVLHPLVTVPVRVRVGSPLTPATLVPAGDVSLTPRITDPDRRAALYRQMEFGGGALSDLTTPVVPGPLLARLGRLQRFGLAAAQAAGFPSNQVVPAGDGPDLTMRRETLAVLAGVAIYAVHETHGLSRASSLRAWAERDVPETTAFHSVYFGDSGAVPRGEDMTVPSPYVLTPAQQRVLDAGRREAVTVVAGGPGTGKSHTLVAVAVDAISRGESVLVAAKTDAAVDALLDLLERARSPQPVVFGSTERRQALATRLAQGQFQAVSAETIAGDREKLVAAIEHRDDLRSRIAMVIRREQLAEDPGELQASRRLAPGLFRSDDRLGEARALLGRALDSSPGVLRRWRRRRAWRKVTAVAGCEPTVSLAELAEALATADIASRAHWSGTTRADWEELVRREQAVRDAAGRWVASETRSEKRWNRQSLGAVGAVATALRSGRAARRERLARLRGDDLTRALPLWVGTLPDIDDLLPPVPGLFDLVILDEASGIDQSLAAPALLRGRRGVVAGDPRQLRHVSFLSDDQLRATREAHGLTDDPVLEARLDLRRNSAFDVAASAARVTNLDEHFRCAPHLIQFAAERLYSGTLSIATRSPLTENVDCIDVERICGTRDSKGIVDAEVRAVVAELRALDGRGARSVGVVSPFRAQADALESAVLETFTLDQIKNMDLRVGTVHAFQGNERDIVIVSLAVGPTDERSWRFVQDPHLFAVLVTRARRRMKWLVSADPPEGGLVAGYLEQANRPYRPIDASDVSAWTEQVASGMRLAGLHVEVGYRTGRHVLDVCVLDQPRPTAISCGVHPEGVGAHMDRHLHLLRSDWQVLEAFPGHWRDRAGELTVELVQALRPAATLA